LKQVALLLVCCSLLGCGLAPRPTEKVADKSAQLSPPPQLSYFQKKIECKKYQPEIEKELSMNTSGGSPIRTMERLYYSPSLDSCVDIVYSLFKRNASVGFAGLATLDIEDVLTSRSLWHKEYPFGEGSKTYEEIMADADQKIKEESWGEK
jgi:hypothetical protein